MSLGSRRDYISTVALVPFAWAALSMQGRIFCAGQPRAHLHDAEEFREERMIAIRPIESMVTVGPSPENADRAKLSQFVLNGAKRQSRHVHELADVTLLLGRWEKEAQQLSAHFRKQDVQDGAFRWQDKAIVDMTALNSQVRARGVWRVMLALYWCAWRQLDKRVFTACSAAATFSGGTRCRSEVIPNLERIQMSHFVGSHCHGLTPLR
jgi:hypothetical protein